MVLLGILDQGELEEFLQGPPLQVEVHDRDRNNELRKVKADLFGDQPEDELINNVSFVAGEVRPQYLPNHLSSLSNTGSIRDDPYWTSRENSLELIELSNINIVSLVLV